MNKKKVTKHKGSKTKSDNESPEVFVLPPNLLERLGINLGNIGSTSESATESQFTDLNIISKDKDGSGNKQTPKRDTTNTCVITSTENESSIIETAKLMKKSVFLSPTFISQNTSVIQGEVEIADNAEPGALQDDEAVRLVNNGFCKNKLPKRSINLQNEFESASNVLRGNSPFALFTQETNQCDKTINDNVKLHDIGIGTVFDDHADEAYSSDGSNSNIGCAANDRVDYNKSNKNKINIISEQIIHPSQLKSDTFNKPAENTFVHVPISTMITNHSRTTSYNDNIFNIELSPNVTTIVNPSEITVANECSNMPDQNCVKLHTNISAVDIPHNIGNIATCAVLNEISSEFVIVTQNNDALQQDGKILQMFLDKGTSPSDAVAVGADVVVPGHLDTVDGSNIMNYEVVDFPASTEIIYADHSDTVDELKVVDTDSDLKIDTSFLTKTTSHAIIPDNADISMSCVNEPEDEDANVLNKDDICNIKRYLPLEHDGHGFEEVLNNVKELKTPVQKNEKQFSNILNGDQDFITENNCSTSTDDQQDNQSGTDNICLSQRVDNTNNRSESAIENHRNIHVNKSLSQCNADKNKRKNHLEIEVKSPSLNMELHEVLSTGKEYTNHEQRNSREPEEPSVANRSSNENCNQNNNATVDKTLSVIQEDKVREIAAYLSKFADMKRRNSFKERRMSCSKTLTNKKHATNSKSSIQGVEKPGGSNKQIRNGPPVNTYGRISRERQKFVQSLCAESHTHTHPIDESDSNSFNIISKEIEVCLCDDFGQLMSYDSENIYEHIHFWNNVKSDVTPDIIFSIYNQDDSYVTIDNDVSIDHDIDVIYTTSASETHTAAYRNICWHEMKNMHDDDYDVDINSDGNKKIEQFIHEEEKHTPHKVNSENVTNNKCNERQETEKEQIHQNNVTTNALKTPEAAPNNKIVRDNGTAKIGRKRKRSIKLDDNDAPPANKYGRISKQSPRTEENANYVKTRGPGTNPVKGASRPLVKKTKSVEQTSVKPSSATATRKQSFILLNKTNDKECPSEPVTEAANNCVEQPSTFQSSNEDQQMNCSGFNEGSSEVVSEKQNIKNEVTAVNGDLVQCGVCEEFMQSPEWSGHIASRHDYLAWKYGEPPLAVNDENAVREHLYEISKASGGLTCAKCGLTRKYVKAYLSHFRKCNGLNESQNDSTYNIPSESIPKVESESSISKAVVTNDSSLANTDLKCAVCEESLKTEDWIHHIEARHDYLAWKVGEPPLDVNDEGAVKGHLYELTKALGGLRCAKCGLVRKYVKAYLSHIKSCNGLDESQNDSTYDVASEITSATEQAGVNASSSNNNVSNKEVAQNAPFRCGVCKESMLENNWISHISSEHDYLAWKLGDSPLDVNDDVAVRQHLNEIAQTCGGLTCAKCGVVRKTAKPYMNHVKRCNGLNESQNASAMDISTDPTIAPVEVPNVPDTNTGDEQKNAARIECGVCHEIVLEEGWEAHIGPHNYLAWKHGEPALDMNDEEAVKEHLYELTKKYGGLKCAKCGLTRKYVKAYQTHIRNCEGPIDSQDVSASNTSMDDVSAMDLEPPAPTVIAASEDDALEKCALCGEYVLEKNWHDHRASRHNNLAWACGEHCLDIVDDAELREHLYAITVGNGRLCPASLINEEYIKSYVDHIKFSHGSSESQNASAMDISTDPTIAPVEVPNVPDTNTGEQKNAARIECGVCHEIVLEEGWEAHIGPHNYLAWKHGEPALDMNDEEAVKEHLYELTKKYGGLKCAKCGLTRKYVKAYQTHIRNCEGPIDSQDVSASNTSMDDVSAMDLEPPAPTVIAASEDDALEKCALCGEYVLEKNWHDHRASRHNNLAWACGEHCLDIVDDAELREHLYAITVGNGRLCPASLINEEYIKSYVDHIKFSHGSSVTTTAPDAALVKCAVCGQYMVNDDWQSHLATKHEYLAWKDGEPPFDVNDEEETRVHLQNLAKELGGLNCPKCGLRRKYVKPYLHHIRICDGNQEDTNDDHNTTESSQAELHHSEIEDTTSYTCGVCNEVVEASAWVKHVSEEHNYLAWKHGETPLDVDDEDKVYRHLYELSKKLGGLICKHCNLNRRYVKSYLEHAKTCKKKEQKENIVDVTPVPLQNLADKIKDLTCAKCGVQSKYIKTHFNHISKCEGVSQADVIQEQEKEADVIICGVCSKVVKKSSWSKHLSDKHNYLAWQEGDTPLDLNDQEMISKHLYDLNKEFGGLTCKHCGKTWKYVKTYSEHVKYCELNSTADDSMSEAVDANNSTLDTTIDDSVVVDFASGGVCAVCQQKVDAGKWIQHTQREHGYLAWREGETPWNVEDYSDISQYLYVICKRMDGLTCRKCGIVRKYVKTYLTHVNSCNATQVVLPSISEGIGPVNKDIYQCAMCKENIKPAEWKDHAMKEHYNVTWKVGETPIDIKNPYVVEKYLKEYKRVRGTLKCNMCGATRASFSGFYAHIITCGKTEEEIDMFRSVCEICNNPYLCIYKNQHAMIHKVQAYTAELKLQQAVKVEKDQHSEEVNPSGKRRAAVKARSVIEKYGDAVKHAYTCQSCGYGTDVKEELDTHKCNATNGKDFSGDESSAAELESSDDESESDVDSNISNEANDDIEVENDDDDDEAPKKRIRIRETPSAVSKVKRIPFKVEDPNSYIRQGDRDFCSTHLTDEVLYPRWLCKYEAVPDSELARYLPPMEHSCKVKVGPKDWTTFNRFQCKRDSTATTLFVGASIVCISWVPFRVEDIIVGGTTFLAVACHNDVDCPRYQGGDTPTHENLIQLWNYAAQELPKLAFGIAHDFGTVWSMAWCPSGARDAVPEHTTETRRLGLLAVACSSGSAYIFSVPHPSTVVKDDQVIYKLKPVAELKMTDECTDRKRYQATSISWSKQKGHMIILVGYADGSTAFYDLHTKSPLLWSMTNDVEVFYPYYDDRPHNTCITGTDLYPVSGDDVTGCGAGAWVAPTGALLATRAGAAGAAGRARLHVASLGVQFAPHAGSAVLAGDDAIMHTAISELVWVPPGRRLGAVRAVTGCARCGRVAASMPPTLRVMRPHPAYDLKKQVVGMLEMTRLAKKRKQVNDELAMTIEPLTYADAISKYGIEFKTINRNDRAMQHQCASKPKAHCPERFPLADVKSMAFCPSRKHHDKLAVATHAGIVFITTLR